MSFDVPERTRLVLSISNLFEQAPLSPDLPWDICRKRQRRKPLCLPNILSSRRWVELREHMHVIAAHRDRQQAIASIL